MCVCVCVCMCVCVCVCADIRCSLEDLPRAMDDRDGWKESGKSVLLVRLEERNTLNEKKNKQINKHQKQANKQILKS